MWSLHQHIQTYQMDKTVQSVKQNPFAATFAQKNIEKLEPVLQDHLSGIIYLLDQSVGEEVDMRQKMVSFMYNIHLHRHYVQL